MVSESRNNMMNKHMQLNGIYIASLTPKEERDTNTMIR